MVDDSDVFIQHLTAAQGTLYCYIHSLLPDRAAAQDVLQEVNLTAWQKRAEFEPGTSFFAWGSRIAYYHVLRSRRKMRRDRLVFDDDVLDYLAERQAERADELDERGEALHRCLNRLPASQREMVAQRYAPGGSVQDIAEATGRTVGSISQSLYRIREALLECIERTMAGGQTS